MRDGQKLEEGNDMVRKRVIKNKRVNVDRSKTFELEEKKTSKNKWFILILVSLVFLTLFMNTYFNYTSGVGINKEGETLGERYYFLGPDPYYHARITEFIYHNGYVPYWQEGDYDPLLEYPMQHPNPRPPLFDYTMAVGAHILSPFMDDIDALGHSLQFLPAIFGALLVIPVFFIATLLFNKKVGLIAALFIAIIPIHIGSGHGSAYALADHDSFLLLLTTTGLYFFLKTLKSINDKYSNIKELFINNKKAIFYSIITGVVYASVALSWEGFKLVVVLLALYCIFQLFLNCVFRSDFLTITLVGTISLLTTTIIILPYYFGRGTFNDVEIIISLVAIILFIGLFFHYTRDKLPYIFVLPVLLVSGVIALFLINMYQIKPMYYFVQMFFSGTVYVGKISLTIAEAGGSSISNSVMSFGPALYWVAWFGAIIFMARTLLHKKKEMVFMSLWFVMTLYFTMTAGRFLNDFVPFVAIFGAWTIVFIIKKVDYKQLASGMRSVTGFKKIKKIKFLHLFGVIFIVFLVLLPNVILAFDAAVPWEEKSKYMEHGVPMGAFGISFGKEMYWIDALSWLADQDTEIENSADRPAFISWWDYGFYEVLVGQHPTVADNFQDGVEPAANFKTSKSEKEAITVLIARLVHGDYATKNQCECLSENVKEIMVKYVGQNNTDYLSIVLDDIKISALGGQTILDYNEPVCSEYEPELSKFFSVNKFNTFYHKFIDFTSNLTDEEVTEFYMNIQDATGWDIRYYGTEQYDSSIFSVFTFLSDKSLMPVGGSEDEFYSSYYIATHTETGEQTVIYRDNLSRLTKYDKENYEINGPYFNRKDAFYDTMFYKTFFGTPVSDGSIPENRMPTYGLRHFTLGYVSPYVVIAKYYEGCKINGTVICQGLPLPGITVVVFDEFGVPHDNQLFIENTYDIIAPAGNLKIGAYLGNNLLRTFNLSVSELEAKRRTENYNKTIDIDIDTVSLSGTLYKNSTVSPDTEILLVGETTGMFTKVKTDVFGSYVFPELPPSIYTLHVLEGDNSTHNETILLYENSFYDVEE